MTSVRYEMQIKTDGYSWKYFDDKKKIEDLECFGYYKRYYEEGKTGTDARIVKIETTRTVMPDAQ